MVTVRFKFSQAENRQAMVHIALRSRAATAMLAMGLALFAGGVAAGRTALFVVGASEIACWAGIVLALPLLGARRMTAGAVEHTLTFSDEGVSAASASGGGLLDWRQWSRWQRSGDLYVLRGARRAFTFVPRRAFATAAEEAEFRDLLARHVRPRASSRRGRAAGRH